MTPIDRTEALTIVKDGRVSRIMRAHSDGCEKDPMPQWTSALTEQMTALRNRYTCHER